MARTPFHAEVLTPDGEVFSGEVEMISTRTTIGSIGILAHHTPLLAMLDPTELRLYREGGDVLKLAQAEGYLQMTGNRALVLVQEAVAPDELDSGTLEERRREAEQEIERAEEGSERRAKAQRDRLRAERFLEITGSGS